MVLKRIEPLSAAKISGLLYAIMGLIVGLISAAIYNVLAGMIGGIEFEQQPPVNPVQTVP